MNSINLLCRFRKAGYQAIDRICDYYSTIETRPVVSEVEPGYLRKALPCESDRHASGNK